MRRRPQITANSVAWDADHEELVEILRPGDARHVEGARAVVDGAGARKAELADQVLRLRDALGR